MATVRPAIAILAMIALIAPASAFAQSAAGEYDNVHLPNAGGKYDLPSTAAGSAAPAPGSSASGGGGGGTAILLVGLLVVAAGCAGVAAWRLRGGSDSDDGSAPPTPPVNPKTTGESGSA